MTATESVAVRRLLSWMVHLTYWYHRHWAHTMGITRCEASICRAMRESMEGE